MKTRFRNRIPLSALAWFRRWHARWSFFFRATDRRVSEEWISEFIPTGSDLPGHRELVSRHFQNRAMIGDLARGVKLFRYLIRRHPDHMNHYLDLQGGNLIDEALQEGRGCILLLSHLGNPHIFKWYLAGQSRPWVNLLLMSREFNKYRKQHGMTFGELRTLDVRSTKDEFFPLPHLRSGLQALRRNELVLIAGDKCDSERPLELTVRGCPQVISTGGISLGLMTGAPVVPFFVTFDSRPHWTIHIEAPLDRGTDPDRSARRQSMLRDYVQRIERFIERHPDNVVQKRYMRRPSVRDDDLNETCVAQKVGILSSVFSDHDDE